MKIIQWVRSHQKPTVFYSYASDITDTVFYREWSIDDAYQVALIGHYVL